MRMQFERVSGRRLSAMVVLAGALAAGAGVAPAAAVTAASSTATVVAAARPPGVPSHARPVYCGTYEDYCNWLRRDFVRHGYRVTTLYWGPGEFYFWAWRP